MIVAPVLLFAWPAYLLAEGIDNPLAHGFAGAFFGAPTSQPRLIIAPF